MRVAQVIDALQASGGAERLQMLFAETVAGSEVELTVITLRRSDPKVVERLEALGARVVSFPARRFVSPSRALELLLFLRREGFDVVHTHLVRSTVLGVLAGRAAAIPTVATLHNTRPSQHLPESLRAAESLVLRHAANRVVAVGWETARVHRSRLRDRPITVIPNAVHAGCTLAAPDRERIRSELGVNRDELLVIAVGRLQPVKAFSDLLAAIGIVCAENLPVQLRIAGGGPLKSDLLAEIERRGLSPRAQLLGQRRDVDRLLAASDLYASSAASEGLSVAALEAMAAGLPVVATCVGDMPRIVDAQAGVLVAPRRPEELARALVRVLSDADLRRAMGEAGRSHVRRHHGVEAWSRQLLSLYAELAGRPAPQAGDDIAEARQCG
jgi:glycosyltransferase involved in cell wall biosynthesis